jgi:hypothetical protein
MGFGDASSQAFFHAHARAKATAATDARNKSLSANAKSAKQVIQICKWLLARKQDCTQTEHSQKTNRSNLNDM